jgi:hypothetical protein
VHEFPGHRLGIHIVSARAEHGVPATGHGNRTARGRGFGSERGGHVDEKVTVAVQDMRHLPQAAGEGVVIWKIEDGVVSAEHHVEWAFG